MTHIQVTYALVSLLFLTFHHSLSTLEYRRPLREKICIRAILALAYRSCHLLGYNKKITDDVETSDVSLESELRRRCFWACWVSTCIVMEPEPYIRSAWQEVAMLPLPACIHDTASGYEVFLSERMDNNWCSSFVDPHESIRSPVAAALLVKIVGVW